MKRHVLAVTGLLLALGGGAADARDLPTLDALATSTASPPRAGLRRLAAPPGAHVLRTDSRLGVPTLVWGSRSAVDPRSLSGLKRMGPEQAARVHLERMGTLYGLTPEVAAWVPATVAEPVPGSASVRVTFRQELEGIEIFRESLTVLMTERHELLALSGYLTPHVAPESRAGKLRFSLDAPRAIARAYEDLNAQAVEATSLARVGDPQGPYTSYDFVAAESSRYTARMVTPARAKRVFFSLPERLVPAWYVELHTGAPSSQDADAYAYVVSAEDGRLLFRHNLTVADSFSYRVWADTAAPFLPHDGPQGLVATPHPVGRPNGYQAPFIAPELVTLQNAPFSRNDPWLPAGATETVGNNVDAYVDISGADGKDASDFRATVTAPGGFDRVYDVTQQPGVTQDQRMAALTQLFYVNNFLHDWFYDAGFNEAAGNAQADNFGRGGLAADSLKAEAQDYSGVNNANMLVPADGARPRMQMYLFAPNTRNVITVLSPEAIAGEYSVATASFGPQGFEVTGAVARGQDSTGNIDDGCQAITTDVVGKIAVIERGNCNANVKVKNAQVAGAVGVIIAHNLPGAPPALTGTDATITIPSLSMSQGDANRIKAELPTTTVTATLFREGAPHRDGSIDNSIVAHEWGHFISNRLIGNGAGLTNNQGRAMGEGWGDFHALLMQVREEDAQLPDNDSFQGSYTFAGYVSSGGGNDGYYWGQRRYPYSTDFTRNALTFKHIRNGISLPQDVPVNPRLASTPNVQVHNSGEVWATMLWECYTALLNDRPRLTFDEARERMKRYLVLGYQLTPFSPTYLEARDALLLAAYSNDPRDYRLCHAAFARRGAGLRAVAPHRDSTDHSGLEESFVTGKDVEFESARFVEAPGGCDNDGVVDDGEPALLRVTLYNTGTETLTATTANVSTTEPGVTLGNGGSISFPAIEPFDSATVDLPASMSGPGSLRFVTFEITYRDGQQAIPGDRTVTFSERVHADELPASSASDDVESDLQVWTPGRDTSLGNYQPWLRHAETPLEHFFLGVNAPVKADIHLTSPPLQVSPTGNFSFTFLHRFIFEADSIDIYDGGVIELSTDDGATWTDIGESASPGYVAVIFDGSGNPLGGRSAYGDVSENYPDWLPVTVDLGTAYQGQTVRVRFRIGTDNSIGEAGWDIDNLSFSGITNTPFPSLVEEPTQCVNEPPVADAGPDQSVDEGSSVVLDGTGSSDPNPGSTLSHAWTQTAGPTVTLSEASTARPGFTAPQVAADTVLTFQLTVSDGTLSSTDTVSVTVRQVNLGPVADAGPERTVDERTAVTLDGRASTEPEGDPLTFTWTQTAGPTVTLSEASTAQPGFTAPEVTADTVLTFELTVSDGALSATDTVNITVRDVPEEGNTAPVANAGSDRSVTEGATVTLGGSGTDAEGDALSYAWTQTSGPSVTLTGADTASASFTAPDVDSNTLLRFTLKVTDAQGSSAEDSVSIAVQPRNNGGGVGGSDDDGGGCGCASSNASAGTLMPVLLLGLALLSRRRWCR
ncbi:myxosortase-dependent M36 family metallopeptidase [Hyalangium rubrum]|uniref:Myxosortase-dependent M36 family metallopeptidase n=1 Tax=Hyalangium rubrum TaxID=3103134 RepID=A0ABU5H2S4_9BACT|nr:myxosortase-dependent M36 family metallopeptidase [Hyalangium sp. s54d21]MDY7227082.1 myxosortase-dependent M36 family metallopeptidase [Hyalangium sp. s54d21]